MPNTSSRVSFFLPPHIQDLFGEPPLFRGEDDGLYFTLMEHFAKFIKPANIIQWWWTKDMTDHTWEIRRLWRFKPLFVELGRDRVLCDRILVGPSGVNEKAESEKDLAEFFMGNLGQYRDLDRLIASAEARRDRTLREIERHQENLARRVREASDEAIEKDITDLPKAA